MNPSPDDGDSIREMMEALTTTEVPLDPPQIPTNEESHNTSSAQGSPQDMKESEGSPLLVEYRLVDSNELEQTADEALLLQDDAPSELSDDILVTSEPPDTENDDDNNDAMEDSYEDDDHTNLSPVNSELIRRATAAAIQDAIAMKRSDSILSTESNEDETSSRSDSLEDIIDIASHIPKQPVRTISRASARYMEEASVESPQLLVGEHTRLTPLGGKIPRQSTDSSVEVVRAQAGTFLDSLNEDDRLSPSPDDLCTALSRHSERAFFQDDSNPPTDSIPVQTTMLTFDDIEEAPSVVETPSCQDTVLDILQTSGLHSIPPSDPEIDMETQLLFSIFQGFCSPSLQLSSIQAILHKEQTPSSPGATLPIDVVIENPSPLIFAIIGTPLLKLPPAWVLSFFRILLRLITNETDEQYNNSILSTCTWYEETYGEVVDDAPGFMSRNRASSASSLRKDAGSFEQSFNRSSDTQNANQMYSVVRLRRNWKSAITQVIEALQIVLSNKSRDCLQHPLSRLLGLLCTSGLSVQELQSILEIANADDTPQITRLLLIRALRTATNGSSRSITSLGKASPRTFFSFLSGPGIVRNINLDKTSWPFKNDFGVAVWFRAECFKQTSTLLRATNQNGDGTEVSLVPLSKVDSDSAKAAVLTISILEGGKVVHDVTVKSAILHERVWYHVSVRHTRSRMKGVFSLSSRELLTVMLDGKSMLTQVLSFPQIKSSSGDILTLTFGANFDGQTGAVHVFNDNVSDTTLKALFDLSVSTTPRRTSGYGEWDSHRGEIVKKSRVLDLSMRYDDAEDIVLSQRTVEKESRPFSSAVVDLDEEDEFFEGGPLSRNAFNSRLYAVWDPQRTGETFALEMHSGAHARLDPSNVQPWTVQGVQDVIGSIAGVQAVLPILRKLLDGNVETKTSDQDGQLLKRLLLCSAVPDSIFLLASLVRDHNENAREMLRCGAIDLLEQLLQTNKRAGMETKSSDPTSSLMVPLYALPSLSAYLVSSLLELRSSCSHYVGLETKVFSRLVFNIPLWFGSTNLGTALYVELLPLLSGVVSKNPEKVRDCVGVKGIFTVLIEFGESEPKEGNLDEKPLFARDIRNAKELNSPLSTLERRNISEILQGMMFQVLSVGSTGEEISMVINTLSNYLEAEWEQASGNIAEGKPAGERMGCRAEKYDLIIKTSTVLLFLLQTNPSAPGLLENFAYACGSVQGGAAWILSAMVNSYCDQIRALGVRCIVTYVSLTARSPDLPLSLETNHVSEVDKNKSSENRRLQENTMSLISNVSHGLMNSNVGKGLAAIGPAVRARLLTPSKLTARVVFKLLWHLLKSHRYRIKNWTHASLVTMVFEENKNSLLYAMGSLKEQFLTIDHDFGGCVKLNLEWAAKVLNDASVGLDASVRSALGIKTIMRLMRFLPNEYADQWLSNLLLLSVRSNAVLIALSSLPDWQPCLFQFVSELVESVAGCVGNKTVSISDSTQEESGASGENSELKSRSSRLDQALELYSLLLAFQFRQGGDIALAALEDCASLQRVCMNGAEVFILIMTRLFSNLSTFGVVSMEKLTSFAAQADGDEPSVLLKKSAKLVTDTILSSSSNGITLPTAVDCWRCLRHLIAIAVAVETRLGFGVDQLLGVGGGAITPLDDITGGRFGIRLEDTGSGELYGSDVATFYAAIHRASRYELASAGSPQEKEIHRRFCVNLSAQVLTLIDVFIFPESLDVGLPTSQLHGLALVRNVETRLGTAQGPLLASLVRLSLLLLNQLEPCSVKLLQCASRLRCFLHWLIELARESEALEGYSSAFNKLTAPFDRLILAIVLQSHETLGRCKSMLRELETSEQALLGGKDQQKKAFRRLLRVSLELRETLVTILDHRNELLRSSLSPSAFDAMRIALDNDNGRFANPQLHNLSPKETLVRKLLASSWVAGYRGKRRANTVIVSELLHGDEKAARLMDDFFVESREISGTFEKALNGCFEKYLETQKQWAETGAVRDLEFEGDTILKKLSGQHSLDSDELAKSTTARSLAADGRWRNIDRKSGEIWRDNSHWKISAHTDGMGRRSVLVQNRHFQDHAEASYELLLGLEREKEEKAREERLRKKEELAELMKRNAEAFVPIGDNLANDDAEKQPDGDETEEEGETENEGDGTTPDPGQASSSQMFEADVDVAATDLDENVPASSRLAPDDADAWAKSFIWSDSESVVARFKSIMIVALQYMVEGNLLLTTHGLYFHQTGIEINVVTRERYSKSDPMRHPFSDHDRRWRLNKLKEVHGRRYMLRANALELFFSDGDELFLNFLQGQKERNRFYAKLRNSCKVPMLFSPKSLNPRTEFKKSRLTELWRRRRISNFEYLMALNRMAGRTFNDIAQYPVFPWILSDYTSEKIDLVDSRVYRDLTKPVGALNPDRLSQLLERYNELEQFGFAENERFLYGSHYSSPGVILHFLIRQEPFTSMAIDLQSGRFDCPDRLFFDLQESWKSCNSSSSDVKELIPEFFTLPELLLNSNNFPLGKTQRGREVGDVGLPPWAKGSAHEFVRIHRLALESEYVSRNLHHWIDLIFGYKQRGVAAEAAHNVFHHLSYEGAVDLDKIVDELDRNAAESHIQNFGQTPSQLLVREPHPPRLSAEECWVPLINNMSSTVRLKCHTPAKQFGGKKGGCGSAIKISVQADSIIVVYSDLKVGTFKWSPKATKNRLKPDRLRTLPNRSVSSSRAVIKRGSAAPQTLDDNLSPFAVGNWSFALTLGGFEREQIRRKALVPSRLASAKDALYTDSASLVVSCGYWDNSVKVHATDTWKLECSDTGGHRGPIRCLAVGSDGGLMITGGEDSTCRVWVVDHPDMAVSLSDGYVQTALGQTTDGDHVLSCCHILFGHKTPITCVDLSPELDVAVSGSLDGTVCVHSLRKGEYIRSLRPLPSETAVSKLALDKHGRLVVHMGDNSLHTYTINGVRLCSVDAGEKIQDMKITGEVLVTGGDRSHVYIRDLVTLKVLSGLDLSRHGPIRCISLTPDELNPVPQHLLIGSDDGMISIVDRDDI